MKRGGKFVGVSILNIFGFALGGRKIIAGVWWSVARPVASYASTIKVFFSIHSQTVLLVFTLNLPPVFL